MIRKEPTVEFTDRLLLRDARLLTEVLSPRDPCVDVTITSPPYWNLKDYGSPNQIGHGQSKNNYLADMTDVLEDCLRVTRPTGSLWLVVDTYREGREVRLLPFELAECARQVGWKLRDLIVWDKQQGGPWQAGGQLRNTSEFVLFLSKSDDFKYYVNRIKTLDALSKWWVDFPERFSPKGKTPTNVWSIPMRPRGRWRKASRNNHYCSFPTALVARIIELTTDANDVVMDPFAGSGVVLAVANVMGRHYVGFEVNKEYVETFEAAVKDEVTAEWVEIEAWREKQEHARADFERTIMSLRALKYARQVTRPFLAAITTDQRDQVLAILCLASVPEEFLLGRPFDVDIAVVVDESLPEFEFALEAARSRSSQPPLTQYGIRSSIRTANYADLQSLPDLASCALFLYPKYKPRQYVASGLLKEWFEEGLLHRLAEDQKVPMLSNVAVDVAWALGD